MRSIVRVKQSAPPSGQTNNLTGKITKLAPFFQPKRLLEAPSQVLSDPELITNEKAGVYDEFQF